MVGFVGENLLNGTVKQFHWSDVADLPRDGSVQLVDVRTPAEYARGHIDGFVNLPLDSLRSLLGQLEGAGRAVRPADQVAALPERRPLSRRGHDTGRQAVGALQQRVEQAAHDQLYPERAVLPDVAVVHRAFAADTGLRHARHG